MALPKSTTFLVIGAGPSGLATAISLACEGCQDVIVVDAVEQGENTSRAFAIHAGTLEALDTVGCAEPLVQLGIKATSLVVRSRTSELVTANFGVLKTYTRYPFALILPQNITERELGKRLRELGVSVYRPKKVVEIRQSDTHKGEIDVAFESGDVVRAKYVIGADGARSIIREQCGITFEDPDSGQEESYPGLTQMALADVRFSIEPDPALSVTHVMGFVSEESFFIAIPLVDSWLSEEVQSNNVATDKFQTVYRIVCAVPPRLGVPPHAPSTEYLQSLVNSFGPPFLSSDPSVNPKPIQIAETVWSTRFRNRAAIANKFFTRFGDDKSGGVVFLVGDAAHIHSPAGGQGMNLGLRDAVGLGPVLAAHLKSSNTTPLPPDLDKSLHEYASARHARGLEIIQLTKWLLSFANALKPHRFMGYLAFWFITFLARFQFIKTAAAWRLSGLGKM